MYSMHNLKRKSISRYLVASLILVIIGWSGLTMYVETIGPSKYWTFESVSANKNALIIFDPDPFYNLDEQVCIAFGKAVAENGINAQIATVAAAEQFKSKEFDMIIYCANTYNWRPDWAITNFIEDNRNSFKNISTVGITLGAGSTESSQKHLEKIIINNGGKLIGSYSLWLWRPNDETSKEPNVKLAVALAHGWGKEIADKIK
jgi:hypothetical protein